MASPTEIARWMREEHDRVKLLVARLAERVASVPRVDLAPWLKDLADEFEQFRTSMEKHFALEEEGGYLEAVTQARPNAHDEVDQLITEHREISRLLKAIFEEASALHPTTPLHIKDVCSRIRTLIGILEHHEDQENRLVSQTFTKEIGSHD